MLFKIRKRERKRLHHAFLTLTHFAICINSLFTRQMLRRCSTVNFPLSLVYVANAFIIYTLGYVLEKGLK